MNATASAITPGTSWKIDEWTLTLRPIGADDGPLWLELVRAMSLATRYKRGSRRAEDLTPEDVQRAVTPDPDREIVLVVAARRDDESKMIGVARARQIRPRVWEFGIVILDEWQGRRIGYTLMRALLDALEARGAERVEGDVLGTNRNMLEFLQRLGFEPHTHPSNPNITRMGLELVKS